MLTSPFLLASYGPVNVVFGIPSEKVIFYSLILLGGLFLVGFVLGLIFKIKAIPEVAGDSLCHFCLFLGLFQMLAFFDLFFNCTAIGKSVIDIGTIIFLIPLLGLLIDAFGIVFLGIFVAILFWFINLLPFFAGTLLGGSLRISCLFLGKKLCPMKQ